MFIDLETISGNGSVIGCVNEEANDVVTPCVFTRPTTLSLKKIIFSPTLPPTPEAISFRERSCYSLPGKTRFGLSNASDFLSHHHSTIARTRSADSYKKSAATAGVCCSWLSLRWRKYLRKSSSHRDVINDVTIRNGAAPYNSFLDRRRAATFSQPASLFEKV